MGGVCRYVKQTLDHLHLLLPGAHSALGQALLGRHAPYVVVKDEPGSRCNTDVTNTETSQKTDIQDVANYFTEII